MTASADHSDEGSHSPRGAGDEGGGLGQASLPEGNPVCPAHWVTAGASPGSPMKGPLKWQFPVHYKLRLEPPTDSLGPCSSSQHPLGLDSCLHFHRTSGELYLWEMLLLGNSGQGWGLAKPAFLIHSPLTPRMRILCSVSTQT